MKIKNLKLGGSGSSLQYQSLGGRDRWISEFKGCLVYRENLSCRTARNTQRNRAWGGGGKEEGWEYETNGSSSNWKCISEMWESGTMLEKNIVCCTNCVTLAKKNEEWRILHVLFQLLQFCSFMSSSTDRYPGLGRLYDCLSSLFHPFNSPASVHFNKGSLKDDYYHYSVVSSSVVNWIQDLHYYVTGEFWSVWEWEIQHLTSQQHLFLGVLYFCQILEVFKHPVCEYMLSFI